MMRKSVKTRRGSGAGLPRRPDKKSAALEQLKRALALEASLERVRQVAMGMSEPADMLKMCRSIARELRLLNVRNIRNVQTAIFNESKGTYRNYEFFPLIDKTCITTVEYNLQPDVKAFVQRMLAGPGTFFRTEFKGPKLQQWLDYQRHANQFVDPHSSKASSLHYSFYSIGPGALGISSYAPLNRESIQILKRFRNVFQLAYRRFMDIEQAIARTREAHVEAALERVRSVAMSMNRPDDLLNICEVLFREFQALGFSELRNAMINIHNDAQGSFLNYDYSDAIGRSITPLSYTTHPLIEAQLKQIRSAHDAFSETVFTGQELEDWKEFRRKRGEKDDPRTQNIDALYYYFYSIGTGSIGISAFDRIKDDKRDLLKRFRNVFDFAYRRYMDVAKAEAQAREAQIEAALERVRGRTMAMQNSAELSETSFLLFEQLRQLGEVGEQISIGIIHADEGVVELYATLHGNQWPQAARVEVGKSDVMKKILAAWKGQERSCVVDLKGKELRDYNTFRRESSGGQYNREANQGGDRWVINAAFFSKGLLSFSTREPRPPETIQLLERFAGVFDLTYTRFLDLKQAEAQAREAQIETALERVRAVAMSMMTSDGLLNVCESVFVQLQSLGLTELRNAQIYINDDAERQFRNYNFSDYNGSETVEVLYDSHPKVYGFYKAMQEANDAFAHYEVIGGELEEWKSYLNRTLGQKYDEKLETATELHYYFYSVGTGALGICTFKPIGDEELRILKRFRNVFDLSYKRYVDIALAEAQAREAQIEAAMEKVRGRAMAMHSSKDLAATTAVVYSELRKLAIGSVRCGVVLLSKTSREAKVFATSSSLESDSLALIGSFELSGHPSFEEQYQCWLNQENYFTTVSGEDLRSRYELLRATLSVPYLAREDGEHQEHGYFFPFSEGQFYVWTRGRYSLEEIAILSRFKTIVELTFRRYLDLQTAEAQAREAQIEASLERVRSRTLAMQKSDELAETAAVLFRQLIALGIAPNRLYIAVIKDENGQAEFWITDEDGSKVSSGFAANLRANGSFQKMFDGWREGKRALTIDMQGKELQEYFQHLSSLNVPFKSGRAQSRRVQNIAFFSKGFIGIASPDEQPEETTLLLERFAAVFNLTLTRFNDLKLAEAQAQQAHRDLIQLQAEKKRAEEALTELRATQEQLVQQEKLASLGQLTAGIAHEIKNPLNFVNNFSSISVELVDEAIEEMKRPSPELRAGEISQLLSDVKANLTRVIEHGTRADGIVKSMLHHSRGSSGKSEPTDLNALIKEYVNLAFHGMRAGKNPINVSIDFDLDESTGKVSLVAEDFSRVIVNVCQNAFDAMREKVTTGEGGPQSGSYAPKLRIRSRRNAPRITVEVEDNGPGIPDAIKDKVLQPFFTTKKGTQGTGLGLSITHDIIKAHRGEISIAPNDSGGVTFSIGLPAETIEH